MAVVPSSLSLINIIETIRFEDEDDWHFEVWFRDFCVFKATDAPKSIILFFSFLFLLEEVNRSPDRKMIKLITIDNLFPPLRHSR